MHHKRTETERFAAASSWRIDNAIASASADSFVPEVRVDFVVGLQLCNKLV